MSLHVAEPSSWSSWTKMALGVIGSVIMVGASIVGTGMVSAYNFGVEREHQRNEFAAVHSDISETKKTVADVGLKQEKLSESLRQEHEDATKAAASAVLAASAAANAAASTAKDLEVGRATNLPRITALEKTVNEEIRPGQARIEQKVDDIGGKVDGILRVTQGHDAILRDTNNDAKAARKALEPQGGASRTDR